MRVKKTKEIKHPVAIEEPKPGPNHLICALCREQFKDYLVHVTSDLHRNKGVMRNMEIFFQIDELLKEMEDKLPSEVKTAEFITTDVPVEEKII